MKFKPIIVVAGEPNSIFLEIFFKSLKKKFKNPIILIASLNLVKLQMNKLNINRKIKIIDSKNFSLKSLNNNCINIINVNYNPRKAFKKITSKSNKYIKKCFEISFKIIKKYTINKKTFLKRDYLGITEYISKNFKIKKMQCLYIIINYLCALLQHTFH